MVKLNKEGNYATVTIHQPTILDVGIQDVNAETKGIFEVII